MSRFLFFLSGSLVFSCLLSAQAQAEEAPLDLLQDISEALAIEDDIILELCLDQIYLDDLAWPSVGSFSGVGIKPLDDGNDPVIGNRLGDSEYSNKGQPFYDSQILPIYRWSDIDGYCRDIFKKRTDDNPWLFWK